MHNGMYNFKNGSRVVGKNNGNVWGKATYRKEGDNIFNWDVRVDINCVRRGKNDFTMCFLLCSD